MAPKKLRTLLVANRGEIAVRIMRTCRDMDIRSVAVFSDADREALHVRKADEARRLPGTKASETYLDQGKILELARELSADAIHPGYGFLSENSDFAQAVRDAGFIFVGPPPEAISLLGDKTEARSLARKLGIPTIPGSPSAHKDEQEARIFAKEAGYPVLVKAAAGGGGKGMRIVTSDAEFSAAFRMAASEAQNAFGDSRVYVERYLKDPHHIEIQVIADHAGNAVSLGERDCSIQRRHQKVIEESPSAFIDEDLRRRMGEVAVRLMKAANYVNAGTVEFLVDTEKNFYFLEVNTRLQVEHPVTEFVTGLDLVREQISIAAGERLSFRQNDVQLRGHAIECRIYAEDTFNEFFPSTGLIHTYREPSGPRIRVDSGAQEGDRVEVYYDPLLAKTVTWGLSRKEAIGTMRRALSEFVVGGVQTTIPFCLHIMTLKAFLEGEHSTQFINKELLDEYRKLNNRGDYLEIVAAVSASLLTARKNGPSGKDQIRNKSKWRNQRLDSFQ